MFPLSILDLSPVVQGSNPERALRNTLDLAQHAERWGYNRFWLAEHHNMSGIASSATSVLIGYVAGGTSRIRVGSGGVMLPNHAPLVIAEQFGTLATLYPGRIDLGLGRAPGTDQRTAWALRRERVGTEDGYIEDVLELRHYLGEVQPGQTVRAIPGAGTNVPIWLLGSSLFSARLAAKLGLPFSFASHFAPDLLDAAVALYRREFQRSETLEKPYVMIGVNVFAADTKEEAIRLFTSVQQLFLKLRRGGDPGPLPPPVDHLEAHPLELAGLERMLAYSVTGTREDLERGLRRIIEHTEADELILNAHIHDHTARLRSFEIAASVGQALP